jgi:hypothetical protein
MSTALCRFLSLGQICLVGLFVFKNFFFVLCLEHLAYCVSMAPRISPLGIYSIFIVLVPSVS